MAEIVKKELNIEEIIKQEVDVKDYEITSIVEDSCFVNIPKDQLKLENTEIKGNPDKFIFSLRIKAHCVFKGGGAGLGL